MNDHESVEQQTATERARELRTSRTGFPSERVSLTQIAGRTLAEPVHAPADVPEYSRATIDGCAFAASDECSRTVIGEGFPENDPPAIDRGEAVAVTTGAPLPASADAVLMCEEATVAHRRRTGPPLHAALFRNIEVETVTVDRPLDIGVLVTRTEIHEDRQPDRDSEMLCALVRRWGHRPVVDDPVPGHAALSTPITLADGVVLTHETVGAGEQVSVVLYEVVE